jgi:hypothetical protein
MRGLWVVMLMVGCGDAPSKTDKQVCDDACAKMISCGVLYEQSSCSTNCQTAAPVFLACARSASSCNDLSLCAFKQYGTTDCAGGGTPSGALTCAQYASCNGACFSNANPKACGCGCNAQLASGKALNALIANQCSVDLCLVQCTPPSTAADCYNCNVANCSSQSAQCASN